MPKRPKTKSTEPPKLPKVEVAPNLTRTFPEFWQLFRQLAAMPGYPPSLQRLFQALLGGTPFLLDPGQAAVFRELIDDLPGWDKGEAQQTPFACPVLFSVAAELVPDLPHSPTRTAQVLDLGTGAIVSLPLSGEVWGLCVPDSQGALIVGAPPGLTLPELQARMANMTGDLSEVSLIPGPMVSLPDGAFFAVLLPGGNAEHFDAKNYVLYQLLGKDGDPPQPPQPWEA